MNLLSTAQPAAVRSELRLQEMRSSFPDDPQPAPEINLGLILEESSPIPITLGEGRGIVIPGGGIYLRSAWVTIRMIRHFGCDLPIELWLLPWETVADDEMFQLRLLGVKIRTAIPGYCLDETITGYAGVPVWLAGWQLKVQAVCQSAFQEVIFLDADCYPVHADWIKALTIGGPTFLGDIIESDHLLAEESCRSMCVGRRTPVDSGCFYVVKDNAAWVQLLAVLNGPNHVRDTYRLFFGDKDCWWISHELTGSPYQILGRGGVIGNLEGIYHAVGVVHRTGHKLTSGQPRNTPQRSQFSGPCEDLVQTKLRTWPILHVRGERDWEIVQSVLELDEYRLRELSDLKTVIDCGGHVGSFSVAVLRLFPACRVIAFEPSAENAAVFRLNCPQAELHVTALGKGTGEVELWAVPGDTAFSTDDRIPGSEANGETAAVSRLSDFLVELQAVDLLKVDIEGDEYDVFADLAETGQIRKVQRIVGEWHQFDRVGELLTLLRPTHHVTLCVHPWDHGYFEAVRVQ